MDLAGLPVPAPVLDSPATRHDLLFLLGRVAQAADASLEAERRCWRDLGAHALGLLDDACRRDDGGGGPEWWLAKAEREIACRGGLSSSISGDVVCFPACRGCSCFYSPSL